VDRDQFAHALEKLERSVVLGEGAPVTRFVVQTGAASGMISTLARASRKFASRRSATNSPP